METAKRRSTPSASALSKKRKTSPSPRRVTRRSSQGINLSSNDGDIDQKQNAELESVRPPPKTDKKKRRSSTRRTSLLATLGCIQLPESSKVAELSSVTEDRKKDDCEKNPKQKVLVNVINDAEDYSTGVSSSTEKYSPNSGVADVENDDSGIIQQKLKVELYSWKKQLEKYRRLENESSTMKPSININFHEADSKFHLWHEQISDLEDKFSNAFSMVSRTMAHVDQLKRLHEAKISELTEEVYNQTFQVRDGGDAKVCIKKIFNNMVTDS